MKITEIQFRYAQDNHNPELQCLCDIALEGVLKLKDIQVCKGKTGYYIKFPNRVTKNQYKYDLFHPINTEFRYYLQNEIISKLGN